MSELLSAASTYVRWQPKPLSSWEIQALFCPLFAPPFPRPSPQHCTVFHTNRIKSKVAKNKNISGVCICYTTGISVNLNFILNFLPLLQKRIMHVLHRKCRNWETWLALLYKHPFIDSNANSLQFLVMKSNHPALTQHLNTFILQPH